MFRDIATISTLVALSVGGGAAVVFIAQRLDLALLILVPSVVVTGLFALRALPFAASRVGGLVRRLRWWHVLWFMFFVSGLTFRVRGAEDIQENPLDPAAFFRILLVGGVGGVLIGAFSQRQGARIHNLFRGPVGWLAAYAVFSVLSTLWSVYPAWTLYRSMEYLTGVALIAAVVGSFRATVEFKALFDWTWLLTGLLLVSVWIGVVYAPEEAMREVGLLGMQLEGVLPRVAANSVGDLGAVIGTVSFVRFLYGKGSSRRFYLLALFLATVTLVLSASRSPLTGFLLAVLMVLFLDRRISLLVFVIVTIPLAASLTPLGDIFWDFFLRGQSEEMFLSLSGRVYWWEAALPMIKEKPLLGHGAYAAGRFLVAQYFAPTLSSLHGTWPEVLIGTGLVGLLLLLGAVLGTWIVMLRRPSRQATSDGVRQQQLRLEAVGVLVLLTVRSVFSVPFIWHPALDWLLIVGYAEFLRRQGTNRVRGRPPAASGW
jgi:O-antigen ligase